MRTLRDMKCGQSAKVVKLHGEGAVKRRIMDMGITKNIEIYVRKVAPLGDPVEVTVRGFCRCRAAGSGTEWYCAARFCSWGKLPYSLLLMECSKRNVRYSARSSSCHW